MTRFIMFFIAIGRVLGGCSQDKINESTKQRVYSSSWDGNPIIIKQRNNNEDYETVNEITDTDKAEKLINALKNAD
ncbi:hypothetical protein CSE16_06730 [Solibacillus sp. R5-41]|uniref:hypothetical protein n=1 Tax=Solibacillus sp. R5-41 TaxID=2048654 RepID=UPI000C12773E|nr:hypothetical protein [Solibacillus sp. R5-41]ATP39772.1 hypothetical protein CSE16_06730 [Solibacillus sp. R5-41]